MTEYDSRRVFIFQPCNDECFTTEEGEVKHAHGTYSDAWCEND